MSKRKPKAVKIQEQLLQALIGKFDKPVKKRGSGDPNATAPYRFKPGYDPRRMNNGGGRPSNHAREVINRLCTTSPPKSVCEAIGLDPDSTWIEAIVFSLACNASFGDVAASREILTNLGLRGSVESPVTHAEVQVLTAQVMNGLIGSGMTNEEMREKVKPYLLEGKPDNAE